MSYLQANKFWLIDRATWQFVDAMENLPPRSRTDVPFYLWERLKDWTGIRAKVYRLELNGFSVHWTHFEGQPPPHNFYDYHTASIHIQGSPILSFVVNPSYGNIDFRHIHDTELRCIYYSFWKGTSDHKEFRSDFFNLDYEDVPHYKPVSTLGWMRTKAPSAKDMLYFGIRYEPFSIFYKNRKLNGKSLALLCGTYAILLGDDFSFDSLVSLKTVSEQHLELDKVAYTVNPYLLKTVVLMG